MTQQQYTPVSWQDETTSQQGTLINAERLNQMQTAHHYADGLEEVDTIPTADPGVAYHKIVYCTADNTLYRWDGEAWTADIDDPTRELLEEHLADHDNPHQVTKSQVGLGNCDNTSDADKPISTATQTALDTKLTQRFTTAVGREYVYAYTRTQQTAIEASSGMETLTIPIRDSEGAMHAQVPASPQATHVINYGWANTELDKKADKATTYTKAETDTLLGGKADKATTLAGYGITDAYTKTEADTLLGAKADDNAVVKLTGDQVLSNGVKANTTAGSSSASATLDVPPRFVVQSTGLDRTASQGINRHYPVAGLNDKNGKPAAKLNIATTDVDFQVYLQGIGKDEGQATLMLAKFDRTAKTWTPTIANDALDAYLPMVRTTGNQTIAGEKTFTNPVTFSGTNIINLLHNGASGNYAISVKNTTLQKNNAPASNNFPFYIRIKDKNDVLLAEPMGLRIDKDQTSGYLGLSGISMSGPVSTFDMNVYPGYVTAKTRAYDPTHTTDVATIGTLDAYTPMVRTTGNQTIQGIKRINGLSVESGIDPSSTAYQEGTRFNVYNTDNTILSNHIYTKSGSMMADQWLVYKNVANASNADRLRLSIRITDNGGEVYANYRWYDADGTMHYKEHTIYTFDRT